MNAVIVVAVIVLLVLIIAVKSLVVIPQATAAVIERLGRFRGVAAPGLNVLVPFFDREKRAMILTAEGQRESAIKTAEGQKQAQILSAEGQKQGAILAAEAERQSRILRAQGERAARYLQAQGQAKAIEKVFAAIKAGKPTPEVLAYQYLQTLPQMAQGDANKVWLVPTDYGKALEGFARLLGAPGEDGVFRYEPPAPDTTTQAVEEMDESVANWFDPPAPTEATQAVRAAERAAAEITSDEPPPNAGYTELSDGPRS